MDHEPTPFNPDRSPPDSNGDASVKTLAHATADRSPSRYGLFVSVLIALLSLGLAYLWQKLDHIQADVARASTDTAAAALEARASAKTAVEQVRELSSRMGIAESKLVESSLQRSQLEELMQSLSRSRDENLIVDIDSGLRLAQQQSQMMGSSEPLIAALKTADQRLKRVSHPRLSPVARAIARDMDRLKTVKTLDIASASVSLDEVSRMVDELPLAQDLPQAIQSTPQPESGPPSARQTVMGWGERIWQEFKSLVRISQIDTADAALLSPGQSFFVRENLKLRLLNARMGLLSRQLNSTAADLAVAQQSLSRYFDPNAKSVLLAKDRLAQIQLSLKSSELPRLDETLSALATAAGATGK